MSVSFICDEENRVIEIPHYFPTEDEVVMKVRSMQVRYVVRCAIWYHLYNFKSVKNTHGGVLILVKL